MASPRLKAITTVEIQHCAVERSLRSETIPVLVKRTIDTMVSFRGTSIDNILLVPPEVWSKALLPRELFFQVHTHVYRKYPSAPRPRIPYFGLVQARKGSAPAINGSSPLASRGSSASAINGSSALAGRGSSAPAINGSPTPAIHRSPTPAIHRSPTPAIPRSPTPAINGSSALASRESSALARHNPLATRHSREASHAQKPVRTLLPHSSVKRKCEHNREARHKEREKSEPGIVDHLPGGVFRSASSLLGKRNHGHVSTPDKGKSEAQTNLCARTDKVAADAEEEPDEMEKQMLKGILCERPNVSFSDIVGLDGPKESLRQMIILPLLNPDIYTGLREPPKGLLLFGPGGNGKTFIAKAVASECANVTFFNLSAAALTSKWVGESEKLMRALFTVAKRKAPSLIFIDEIDSILSKRGGSDNEASRRLKTEFLVQFDGLTSDAAGVIFLTATNRPWDLDEAALRRFTERFYVPLPTKEARLSLLTKLLKSEEHSLTQPNIDDLVEKTEGYAAFEVHSMCRRAAQQQMRELNFEVAKKINLEELRPLCVADFCKALKVIRAANSTEAIKEHEKWNAEYGVQE